VIQTKTALGGDVDVCPGIAIISSSLTSALLPLDVIDIAPLEDALDAIEVAPFEDVLDAIEVAPFEDALDAPPID